MLITVRAFAGQISLREMLRRLVHLQVPRFRFEGFDVSESSESSLVALQHKSRWRLVAKFEPKESREITPSRAPPCMNLE
ncbi:uncharacterized protein G2W53_041203 [Senna tora]|uniref:Uncharacterized protein n=1 Tax=Senna tora TaxID=362788 RepID=A0A834SF14_9FABA|nr:uncharacterized protein G2W53_041203 [Senna tora]